MPNRLHRIRNNMNLTLLDMQSLTGIRVSRLSDIERNKAVPGTNEIEKIAQGYGISDEEARAIVEGDGNDATTTR